MKIIASFIILLPTLALAQSATQPADQTHAQLNIQINSGLAYLKSQQKPDGGWSDAKDPPAVTALVLKAFVQDPRYSSRTPFIRQGYEKLFTYQLDSGEIAKDMLINYNTAIAISSIAAAHDRDFAERLERAVNFLKGLQWTEGKVGPNGEKIEDDKSNWYGGWGYGRHGRPDLSNAHFAIQALHDAGLKEDDPSYKAAMKFISRTQNLSQANDQAWAGDDGGFVYTGANEGDSEAGGFTEPDGKQRWRSYGSMTYAGLKSMIYAGLPKDDPRMKGAMQWIVQNWTLDENPAMKLGKPDEAQHGLYYYFYVFGHALNAYDQPRITDAKGVSHDWRAELVMKLASLQRKDGSWAGERRWMEDNPMLVTAYAVLALQEAQQDLAQHP